MTLAISIKYPCGLVQRALASLPNARLQEAVMLATDTRWTKYYSLHNNPTYEDVATKLFTFPDNNALIAYAGDVQSGEHCISEFKANLESKKLKNMTVSLYMTQRTFQRIYHYHKKTRPRKVFPLYFLLGVRDNLGKCSLIYFSSPKFAPIFLEGVKGIGIRQACKVVEENINQEIHKLDNVNIQEDSIHFGMLIAGTMYNLAVRSGEYNEIGGFMQFAILDRKGITLPSLSWTEDPTGKTDIWHRATAQSNELTTYQTKYNLGPDYVHVNSFKLYSISD